MDPIHVPRPPKEAYNKNRPISDLIKAQLTHFQHLEQKLPADQRPKMAHHELTTESAAARYIAAMTEALCRVAPAPVLVMPRRAVAAKRAEAGQGIALAAAADHKEARPSASHKRGGRRAAKKSSRRGKSS